MVPYFCRHFAGGRHKRLGREETAGYGEAEAEPGRCGGARYLTARGATGEEMDVTSILANNSSLEGK